MATNFYYVYALKDPTSSPAKPFYIGKGTGSRAYDHLVTPDTTKKYKRIEEILATGKTPLIGILADDLTEAQALKLESELISAFGTEETGGCLTNAVVPAGLGAKNMDHVVIPQGVIERAQLGLELLKSAVYEFAQANPDGVSNSLVASLLGLKPDMIGFGPGACFAAPALRVSGSGALVEFAPRLQDLNATAVMALRGAAPALDPAQPPTPHPQHPLGIQERL